MRACRILLVILLASVSWCRADESSDRKQDIAQMKRVWEALMAYKKSNGRLPDQLSDLVPEFLPDPKVLISPRDTGGQANGPLTRKEDKHPSSYGYEWGPQPFRSLTFTEVKQCQVEEYGPVVPLLRCFLHGTALNISHDGEFYETDVDWEFSPVVQEIIRMRGLGPGASKGTFLNVTTTDQTGKPLGNVRIKVTDRRIEGVPLPDRTMTASDDGVVRIPFGPAQARFASLSFEREGYFALPLLRSDVPFEEKLTVGMFATRPVGGVVTDPKGKAVAGAKIVMKRISGEVFNARQPVWPVHFPFTTDPALIGFAESDGNGRWRIERVPVDSNLRFALAVSHPAARVWLANLDDSALDTGGFRAEAASVQLSPPLRVRGTLKLRDGSPAARASIFIFAPLDPTTKPVTFSVEGKGDDQGRFDIPLRMTGEAKIGALMSGQTPIIHSCAISDGGAPFELQFPRGRKLRGTVSDELGRPVAGLPVYFVGTDNVAFSEQPVIATTIANGTWEWAHAPATRVRGAFLPPSGELYYWMEGDVNQPISATIPAAELHEQ